jgi:hypothetical protein
MFSKFERLLKVFQEFGSRRGFDPRPMLDGSGVKAIPGSISTPNSGSL